MSLSPESFGKHAQNTESAPARGEGRGRGGVGWGGGKKVCVCMWLPRGDLVALGLGSRNTNGLQLRLVREESQTKEAFRAAGKQRLDRDHRVLVCTLLYVSLNL